MSDPTQPLEPDAETFSDNAEDQRQRMYLFAQYSIAISLKRIADALERPPLHRETEEEIQDYLDRLARSYGVGP
jgi:hypothetical protein